MHAADVSLRVAAMDRVPARSFFDIERAQRRRSALLLAAIGLFYFVIIGGAAFLVRCIPWWLAGEPMHRADWAPDAAPAAGPDLSEILRQSALFAGVLGGALLVIQVRFARRHAVETILTALRARDPDLSDRYHKRFQNLVEEMQIAGGVNVAVRAVVMPTLAPAAFAAQDLRSGAVIGVTEGLLGLLNRDELQAVTAHEMTHIREGVAAMAAYTCALLAPFVSAADWAERSAEHAPPDATLPVGAGAALVNGAAGIMRLACTALSRERELLADAGAVELTRNPAALASALWKLSATDTFLGGTAAAYAPIFILDPARSMFSEKEGWFSDVFSSHPPMRRRLAPLLAAAHLSDKEIAGEARVHPGPDGGDEISAVGEKPAPIPKPLAALLPMLGDARSDQNCPSCAAALHEADYEGVKAGHCTACGGYLIATESLPRILSRREMGFDESLCVRVREQYGPQRLRRPADLLPSPDSPALQCPLCNAAMTRQHYSYQTLVVVDRCYGCSLTWFGGEELEAVQILLESARSGPSR